MVLSDMQTLMSYWLDDPNFGYFTKAQLKFFLNNALLEVQKILLLAGENYYVKTVTQTQIANQKKYLLPSDFYSIHKLETVLTPGVNETAIPLEYTTPGTMDGYALYGSISAAFYLEKNSLCPIPVPQDNSRVYRMKYSTRVKSMESPDDSPDCPQQYHEMVAIFATVDCLLKDGREASLLLAKKKDFIDRMDEVADERILNQPRHINSISDNFFLW
jgi:hypothetical protein